MNSQIVKETARGLKADLVGIAPIDRFASLPAEKNPASIFPECKSVIVVGKRVLRGALRGIEEGTNFGSTYGFFGRQVVEDNFLAQATYSLTCWIEEQGFEAVPIFGYGHDADMSFGIPVADGKPAPNVIIDPEFTAQAAGLAEIGLGGFAITPEYGIRQRFAFILTDCELEADAVREKSICGDCKACMTMCPLGAYTDSVSKRGVPGAECEVVDLDTSFCKICPNGASQLPGRGGTVDRIGAACGRACVVQLEKAGKCSNRFTSPFRKRKPWALDSLKNTIPSDKIGTGCDGGTVK